MAVTVPAGLAPGAHHLVRPASSPGQRALPASRAVTVAMPANQLAWTGFETLPVLGAGVLAVLLGAGLVVLGRRRRTA